MEIKKLLKNIPVVELHGETACTIQGIAYDSRKVRHNYLFVAIPGAREDGMKYAQDAVRNGAAAILTQAYDPSVEKALQIVVADPRAALSQIAKDFYGNPSARLFVVGITGTNGKTTTSYLIESILGSARKKPMVIGTINYRFMNQVLKAVNTTPESLDICTMMADYLKQGATDLIMEVSSHAISQGRVDGIDFDVAIFTNLTQDHLDYHKTMENYFAAKSLLFEKLLVASHKSKKFAILNSDDLWVNKLKIKRGIHILRFGRAKQADIRLLESTSSLDGITMKLATPIGTMDLASPLVGSYNISNIMAAVATALVTNISLDHIQHGVASLQHVPGRVERVSNPNGVYVFVDYAHTPDALEKVLTALSELNTKRLICVFGCGGDRDTGKRPLMGGIATRLSDITVITSDNPRTEDPEAIIAQIEQGIRHTPRLSPQDAGRHTGSKAYMVIADRREAIRTALKIAGTGDVLLIAGKGHEDYQIFRDRTIHFSDRETVNEYFGMSR